MIRIGKTTLAIIRWRGVHGRTYTHTSEVATCLTCAASSATEAPVYTAVCQVEDHKRHQIKHVELTEAAPEESKRLTRLYGLLQRTWAKAGYACGDAMYLLGADADLPSIVAGIRATFAEANASFTACHADFDVKEIVLVPADMTEETMASVRRDIETGIQRVIDALAAGDAKSIRTAAREARGLAAIVEGDSRLQVNALTTFAGKIADRLREAADASDDEMALIVAESRNGSARFAALLDDAEAAPEAAPEVKVAAPQWFEGVTAELA
jgi:hypothetical protein